MPIARSIVPVVLEGRPSAALVQCQNKPISDGLWENIVSEMKMSSSQWVEVCDESVLDETALLNTACRRWYSKSRQKLSNQLPQNCASLSVDLFDWRTRYVRCTLYHFFHEYVNILCRPVSIPRRITQSSFDRKAMRPWQTNERVYNFNKLLVANKISQPSCTRSSLEKFCQLVKQPVQLMQSDVKWYLERGHSSTKIRVYSTVDLHREGRVMHVWLLANPHVVNVSLVTMASKANFWALTDFFAKTIAQATMEVLSGLASQPPKHGITVFGSEIAKHLLASSHAIPIKVIAKLSMLVYWHALAISSNILTGWLGYMRLFSKAHYKRQNMTNIINQDMRFWTRGLDRSHLSALIEMLIPCNNTLSWCSAMVHCLCLGGDGSFRVHPQVANLIQYFFDGVRRCNYVLYKSLWRSHSFFFDSLM